jgi:predicted XRE-type DNA-binding protein
MTKANAPRSLSELDRLDDFLDDEGIREEVEARAVKRVIALQLQEAMKARNLTRAEMAELMDTSRAQLNRVLNPDAFNITLETLSKAAHIVGRKLKVELA